MATNQYVEQTATGYNSSPPPDDGTQVSANEAKWSDVKTKLADPVKTLADAIDDAVLAAFAKTVNTDDAENNTINGSLAFGYDELTIATGSVTPNRSHHTIDTQADASTDDLDTIATGSVDDGCLLILSANHTDRTIVCKHGTGNLLLSDDSDYSLDDTDKRIVFQRFGASWYEICRSTEVQNIVQVVTTQDGAVATGTTVSPDDDTIPQSAEGDQYMTLAITPTKSGNKLIIEAIGVFANSNQDTFTEALFQDSTVGALAAVQGRPAASNEPFQYVLRHVMSAGTVSATTFKVRAGNNSAGTTTFNGAGAARTMGGVMASSITITEVKV